MTRTLFFILVIFSLPYTCNAQETYTPSKVVYDVATSDTSEVNHILDRVSFLQNVYDNNSFEASIIIMLHEGSIPLFAKTSKQHQAIAKRAESLTLGEIIQFRLCRASARLQGYKNDDFPGFIKIIPMADAEIVKLQNNGYAYLK